MKNILIVDDEPVQSKIFAKFISGLDDFNVITLNSGQDAIDFFYGRKTVDGISISSVELVLLDLSMPDVDGINVLKKIAPVKGNTQVIALTASSEISMAIVAINVGASDYIIKGERDVLVRLVTTVNNALDKKKLKRRIADLERKNHGKTTFADVVGASNAMVNAMKLAKQVVNSTIPVLFEGENGTGKEFMARVIHSSGTRFAKAFVPVDFEKVRPDNFDEVFFGSEKVAIDSTMERSLGKIREADGGTLFLKNIHCLKPEGQLKLLRFLQDGEVTPINSRVSYKVNVRIISSTLTSLETLVRMGKFREDLYYRLNIYPIYLPTLTERGPEDVRLLAESFCYNYSISENKKIKGLSSDAIDILTSTTWDDNVQQLENHVFRAVVLCDGQFLEAAHFSQLNKIIDSPQFKSKKVRYSIHRNSELIDIFKEDGSCKTLEEITTEVMQKLSEIFDHNLSEVSKSLDVGRSTIYRKLNHYRKAQDDAAN